MPPVSPIQLSSWDHCLPMILIVRATSINSTNHFFFINPSSSLDVLSQPNVSLLAVGPTFDLSGFRKGLEVIVPQPLTIRVPITGYPTPVAKWTFGEKELTPADERVSMVTKPTHTELTISPSVRPDKGIYTLQLENDVSSVSGDIDVNVIGKNP